jgi:valyl-tRNA synthetase
MSKSTGNGVDPVDIIHTHGADAMRYSLADMTTETQDIRMPVEYVCPHCGKLTDQAAALKAEEQSRKSRGERFDRKLQPADCRRVKCAHRECGRDFATQWADEPLKNELRLGRETSDKFDIGRNFCNKLWNAARFAFMNLSDAPCRPLDVAALPPEDRWILARLSQTIRKYHECLAGYQFSASVKELRDFFWDSLCDWYLELTKPRFGTDSGQGAIPQGSCAAAKQVLAFCLDQTLRLWHPTIPFITERLWQELNALVPRRGLPGIAELRTDTLLVVAAFPPVDGYPAMDDSDILGTFADLQDATRGVRDLRSQCGVSPKERVRATVVVPADHLSFFQAQAHVVRHMAGIGEFTVATEARRPRNAASLSIGKLRIFVHDISDDAAERQRAVKQLTGLERQIGGARAKLSNPQFLAHADPDVVDAERHRLTELLAQQTSLTTHLAELEG